MVSGECAEVEGGGGASLDCSFQKVRYKLLQLSTLGVFLADGSDDNTYSMLVVALPSLAMRLDFQIQAPISSSISEKFRATVDR